jgi:hypothetical protein
MRPAQAGLTMRAAIIAADTVTCSTWQQITTCAGPGGFVSHETRWNGITTGDDNRGGKWTRSEWQGQEIITVTPRQER